MKPAPTAPQDVQTNRLLARLALHALFALAAASLLMGVSYVVAQWSQTGRIVDGLFISLLVAATFFLERGVRRSIAFLRTEGLGALLYLQQTSGGGIPQAVAEFLGGLLEPRRAFAAGLVYGSAVAGAIPLFGVWGERPALALLLTGFLFTVNAATGIALFGLLQFFFAVTRLGRTMRIDLWQVDNPATTFVLGATRRIAVMTALYSAVCNSSILFSLLPLNRYIVGYFIFSGLVLASSIAIPIFPIVQRLQAAKRRILAEFDRRLFDTFSRSLGDPEHDSLKVDLESLKTLLELRERIQRMDTWPFRLQAVFAALSVLLLSAIPVFLQIAIERLIR